MPDVNATPVSLKCKICGGDIVNDYLAGSCVCAHCGNKWSLEDLIPDYSKYSNIISKIKRANDFLDIDANVAATEQARLLYQGAASECEKFTGAVATELLQSCKDGMVRAEKLKSYIKGRGFYEKKSYHDAMKELKKVSDFMDSGEMIEQCKVEIAAERKRQIPLAVIMGMILPAILAIFLKEKLGLPLAADIPIFLVTSAGLGYVFYRGGIPATILKVVSFMCAVPLIIFLILAYGFHVDIVPAVCISVGAPIALILAFGILAERKS